MSDDVQDFAAIPARPLSGDEFFRLFNLGVIGEKAELFDGQIRFGNYPYAFSREAVEAARAAGIELDPARLTQPTEDSVVEESASDELAPGAIPASARLITAEEIEQLIGLGVLGAGGVELDRGVVRLGHGGYPFLYSREAVDAARTAGIELDPRRLNPPPSEGAGESARRWPSPSDPRGSDGRERIAQQRITPTLDHAAAGPLGRSSRGLSPCRPS